ncbi:MAG: hypothetical protein R2838_00730 [Caldilineaceae bacterium]
MKEAAQFYIDLSAEYGVTPPGVQANWGQGPTTSPAARPPWSSIPRAAWPAF